MGKSSCGPSPVSGSLPEDLTTDDAFALLSSEYRRHLLRILAELETPEDLESLTRNLATEVDASGEEDIRRIRARLYHCDVPKLDRAGLVSSEGSRGIELTDGGRTLANAL